MSEIRTEWLPVDVRLANTIRLKKTSEAADAAYDSHDLTLSTQSEAEFPAKTFNYTQHEFKVRAVGESIVGPLSTAELLFLENSTELMSMKMNALNLDKHATLGGEVNFGPSGDTNRIWYYKTGELFLVQSQGINVFGIGENGGGLGYLQFGPIQQDGTLTEDNRIYYDNTGPPEGFLFIANNAGAPGIQINDGWMAGLRNSNDGGDLTTNPSIYFDKLFPGIGNVLSMGGYAATGETAIVRPYPGTVKTAGNLLSIGNDDGAGNFSSRARFKFDGNLVIGGPSASAGTKIFARREDGTFVSLAVDNTNSLIIIPETP